MRLGTVLFLISLQGSAAAAGDPPHPPIPAPAPPAPGPTPALGPREALREEIRANIERILDEVAAATTSPDFTMWWSGPPLAHHPELVLLEDEKGVASAVDLGTSYEVHVYRDPILRLTKNSDEVAFILAHEVMHLLARDGAAYGAKWEKSCDAFLTWLAKRMPALHKAWRDAAAKHAAASGELSEDLRDQIAERALRSACVQYKVGNPAGGHDWDEAYLAFTREREAQADHWAWKLLESAGRNPRKGMQVFTRLGAKESDRDWAAFSSHYPMSLRTEELKRYADSKYQWMPPPAGPQP